MKLPKRIYIITAIVSAIGISGTAYALTRPGDAPAKEKSSISEKKTDEKTEAQEQEVASTQADEPQAKTQTPVVQTETPPEPEPVRYGLSPTLPNTYVVFDKAWVMQEAGVSADNLPYLDKILGGWVYKGTSQSANLCGANPAIKMKSAGDDYLDSPVTQLKWCNNYAVTRYGSWENAAAHRTSVGYF